MKKTTLALLTSAFVASSASAYTLVDNQDWGTKLDFSGSARIMWKSTSDRNADGSREHINHAVANNGSRFGFRLTQQLTNDFYALGRVEWRFRGTSKSQHNFDDIYTRQLYAGFGHKKYGELTYGNMTTITDEVKQTDLPNTLSLSDGLLTFAARRAIQYTYRTDGLKLGAFYGDSSPRGNDGLSLTNKRKDVWGAAAIYNRKIDRAQSYKIALGLTRDRYNQATVSAYDRIAYALGLAYTYENTTFGLDLEQAVREDYVTLGSKRTENEARAVIYHKLNKDWAAYTMYAYKTRKDEQSGSADVNRRKRHQYMVGSEYFIIPRDVSPVSVKTFLEFQATRDRNYANGAKVSRSRNYTTLAGLRIYW